MNEPSETARPQGNRRRTAARLAAVQALYQIELTGSPTESVIAEFQRHRLNQQDDIESCGEADPALFGDLVRGASARRDDLDRMIGAALTADWPLARLESVLRAILRMGAYELFAGGDVPAMVVISEYLDIAHAFFDGKEPGLINGVLDRLAHTLRAEELAEGRRGGSAAPR